MPLNYQCSITPLTLLQKMETKEYIHIYYSMKNIHYKFSNHLPPFNRFLQPKIVK